MEVPDSPVLSCKKGIKRHDDLIGSPILSSRKPVRCVDDLAASPVLSNGRKRKRRPSESPVFLRSSCSRKRPDESPNIDHYFSPARNKSLPGNSFKPKSLFAAASAPVADIEATSSQESGTSSTSSQTTGCQVIEDSVSEDETSDENLNILDRTFSDEEVNVSDIRSSRSNSSFGITQSSSFLSLCCTPPKRSQKKANNASACSGSSRKKTNLVANGMAQQLTRLIARQETDYRLWRFQLKLNRMDEEKASRLMVVRIVAVQPGRVHRFAECKLVEGDAGAEDVCLVFTNERWERLNLRTGDVVSINEPWQSVLLGSERRGSGPLLVLVLAFNLIRKRGELLGNPRIEDTAPRRRPCSSPSADSATAATATAAENKRPSTVVLQAWTCTSQGCQCHFRSAP